jgi:hypothetical protein
MKIRSYVAFRFCCICVWSIFVQTASAQDIQQIGMSPEGPIMRASVSPQAFAQNFHSQQMPEWCWVASISNIFAYYGHPLRQDKIVQFVYGSPGNLPALSPQMIAAVVNRPWQDDNGVPFRARLTAAYDAQAGVLAINNMYIVNELSHGRPLLVCNAHHCMVITAVEYTPLQVTKVWVFDPWPLSPRVHVLPTVEAVAADLGGQLTFVGAVTVR